MPRKAKDKATYDIQETIDVKVLHVSSNLENARKAAMALVSGTTNSENLDNPVTSIQCTESEANILCDWLLEKGYGDISILKRAYEKRIGK